ncbi:MAG: hypothetical protein DCC71_15800 [Proteobacteria bacterium]|nr:MAG: hypothetical protein DCC71_15800 [Pseudomonadota bacterium]
MPRASACAWVVVAALAAGEARASAPPEALAAAVAVARSVRSDVEWLAADALEGRGSETAGAFAAEELLIDALAEIGPGLDAARGGRDAYRQDFEDVRTNLLAVVPGSQKPEEYVLVGAHYDHLPLLACPGDDAVCNGATDNATGVAIALAIGRALRALPEPPARSVVIALWDGEEVGLLGSRHFAASPLVPLADVVANVNFDIQGAAITPSGRRFSFAVGAESGGPLLAALTDQAIAATALGTRRLSLTFGQGRSDYESFRTRRVPFVFFTDATNACYHTAGDEVGIVHFDKLADQAEIGFRLVLALAESDERPAFTPAAVIDRYEDVVVLSELFTRWLDDLEHVYPWWQDELTSLEREAREAVEAGPDAFTPATALVLAQRALGVATSGYPCDPLLLPEPGAALGAGAAALALAASRRRVQSGSKAAPRRPKSHASGHSISA